MSDYYECPECGDNQFVLEWGRIECSKNGHGVPDGWPSASKKAGMGTLHDLALALDLLRDLEFSSFCNDNGYSCPECGSRGVQQEVHNKDCRLAAMIGAKVKA